LAANKTFQANVEGAKELRQVLKDLGDRALLRELRDNNIQIALMIVERARQLADAGRERKVASAMRTVNSANQVSIRLPQMIDVSDKRGLRQVGLGTEFGAYRNRRRLVKNTGGRRTIVRDDEDLATVIRRVENQTIMRDRFGGSTTMPKRSRKYGTEQVRVTKVIRGWNGFKPWKGNDRNAGYFMFPAIRDKRDEAIELYLDKVNEIWTRHKAA